MSRYKAYPEFKDSGIDWIDRVPEEWSNVTLRWASRLYAGGTPSKEVESYWENGTIPWINSGEVNQGQICEASTYITEDAYKNSSAKWIPKGALVMALAGQGKTKGMVAQLAIDATCNQSMAAIVPSKNLNSRYLFWWLSSNYQNIRNMAGGDLRDGLNLDLIAAIGCPVPSAREMEKIANFLDHETAKIDTLIAKQQDLIKLLKEKRQAVISHAVTKGLNPNAPMRDSGVEWLGEVPAHWNVAPLKHLCALLKDGTHLPPPRVDAGIPLLSVRNIIDGKFTFREDDSKISEAEYLKLCRSFIPTQNDVVLAIVGGTIGKVAIIEDMSEFHIQRSIAIFRVKKQLMAHESLANIFGSSNFQNLLWGNVGFSAQPGIYLGTLANFCLPVPPMHEQIEINKYCHSKTQHIDILIEQAALAVELIQERRTALISAAVTGKIDVRDWQAPTAETSAA
ncbi:restriction endonuclease subunit S [Undibacterium luofuense]|uniref:Restriction endonuclease subunit S n=1 Tax=Undibacterium luofuense TaxID=2828733 RepID=A0A941DTB5_9BURK|nr:restriction endonuclease subunit S [Undibacterium luofuense]MBR7783661.1 restriction endonuclease subunit S [Undibacterium luofuense]